MADNSIKDRILEFCKVKGISIRQFEIQCKMSNGYISSMRKGLGEDKLNNVLNEFPELSRNWLLYGDGDMFNTTYNRIKIVLEREGYTEDEFAKGVDFWFPGVYKRAKKNPGDIVIAKQWVDSLLKLFPRYSRQWLLYGDGDMFGCAREVSGESSFALKSDKKIGTQDIPLYDLNATAGLTAIFSDLNTNPEDFLRVPNLPPVDGAIYVRGESMTPLLKSGDIIIFKKMELTLDSILWGQIYLLSFEAGGDNFTVVKYVQKSDQPDYIRLVSHNPRFEPKDIPVSSIRALAIVKASLTFHTME